MSSATPPKLQNIYNWESLDGPVKPPLACRFVMKCVPKVNMMRIALAGSSGLAQTIAHYLNQTVHPFIVLSRSPQPHMEALGYQVAVIDYNNQRDLRYYLQGIDVVISTVMGAPQIDLIDAAAHARVRTFVPAEFSGPPSRRPTIDPFDCGRAATLDRLKHWAHSQRHPMRYTIFSCGILYERFAPGGLYAKGMGTSSVATAQGSFLMDVGKCTAEMIEHSASGGSIYLCMTSLNDLARMVVASLALDPRTWPKEFRIRGDRMTTLQVLEWAESVRDVKFAQTTHEPRDLPLQISYAEYCQDLAKVGQLHELAALEQRRYDYSSRQTNLNELLPHIRPISFWDWLSANWAGSHAYS